MTNEEKIKAMSTEELTKAIKRNLHSCIDCPAMEICSFVGGKTCLQAIEEWLKEEAEDGQH